MAAAFMPTAPRAQQGGEADNVLVRKLSGLAALSSSDVAALTHASAQTSQVQARVDLMSQGEAPTGALVLLEGFACRYTSLVNGRRQISAVLLPGDLCDLDGASIAELNHAVGTLTSCRIARVSFDDLKTLVAEHPQVATALRLAKLAEEAALREGLVSLGCRSAPERLGHLLCDILVRLQAVGLAHNGTCHLPLTQAEMADATGLSAVHVNRSLQALRAAGLLRLASKTLHIDNLSALSAFCGFAPVSIATRSPSRSHAPARDAA